MYQNYVRDCARLKKLSQTYFSLDNLAFFDICNLHNIQKISYLKVSVNRTGSCGMIDILDLIISRGS